MTDRPAVYRALADRPLFAWALGNPRLRRVAPRPGSDRRRQESRDIYADLTTTNSSYRSLLADSAFRLAQVLQSAGQLQAALTPAREAVTLYEQLVAAHAACLAVGNARIWGRSDARKRGHGFVGF